LEKNFTEAPIIPKVNKEVAVKTETLGAPSGELKALNKKIGKKSTEIILLERAQDFSKSVKEVLPGLNEKWQQEAKSLLKKLEDCQGKDFCEMKPDEDGYFDESQTHARKSQVRLLQLLNKAYEENQESKFLLPNPILDNFLQSGNDELAKEAVLQLQRRGELRKSLSNMKGKSVIRALELINLSTLTDEDMQSLIEESLTGTDAYTTVLIFEKLGTLKFNESGFGGILRAACHLQNGMKHNWRAIVVHSDEISRKRGFRTKIATTCQ
jgi:hypothetical protein